MLIDEQKSALNAKVKQAMGEHLRSLTWEEKVASIVRMNVAGKLAREGMRQALAQRAERAAGE